MLSESDAGPLSWSVLSVLQGMGRVFRAFEEKHAETFMLHYADSEPIQAAPGRSYSVV